MFYFSSIITCFGYFANSFYEHSFGFLERGGGTEKKKCGVANKVRFSPIETTPINVNRFALHCFIFE